MKTEFLIESYEIDSNPYGFSYGRWTVEWWRWAMSSPRSQNPLMDKSGEYSHVNQPEKVWFLAGRFGSQDLDHPHRKCTIPAGRSVLFPVINCEANSIEYPHLKTERDLLDHVTQDLDSIVERKCIVNSQLVIPVRVRSDPVIFSLSVSPDLEGLDSGFNDIPSTADGYWVFLKPLMRGYYDIDFVGKCEYGRLSSGASYKIKIE
jgi:hypothetical protein